MSQFFENVAATCVLRISIKAILTAPIVMIFSYCVLIRCQAEYICERTEAEMKVRPQAQPGSKRAKRVCSFHYAIKSSRPKGEQCKRAKRVCPTKENATPAPRA